MFFRPNVEKLEAEGNVEGLIRALQYADDNEPWSNEPHLVRCSAVGALGRIGDKRAIEPLIATLEPLIAALRGTHEEWDPTWRYYMKALQNIGDVRAVEWLIALLGGDKIYYRVKEFARDALIEMGEVAVEPLIAALKDQSDSVREYAVMALGEIGDKRAVEPLIAALKDQSVSVRRKVVLAFRQIGDKRSGGRRIGYADFVKPLIAALKDPCHDVRSHALSILVYDTHDEAVEPLIAALKDQCDDVRKEAVTTLGKIGDKRGWLPAAAVEPLIAALKDQSDDVRNSAARALGQIGDKKAVEPLVAALKDQSDDVRNSAAEALEKIGDVRAVEPLIAALKDQCDDVRRHSVGALGEIGDKRAVEPLIAALKDQSDDVRRVAAWALGGIGDKRSVGPLIAALKDQSDDVRRVAVWALGKIGDKRAVDPLLSLLKDDPVKDVREKVAEALNKLGWQPIEPHSVASETQKFDSDQILQWLDNQQPAFREALQKRDFAWQQEWIRRGRPGAGQGHKCEMCGKSVYVPADATGDPESKSIYRCESCGAKYCRDCLIRFAPNNHCGGKCCPKCFESGKIASFDQFWGG